MPHQKRRDHEQEQRRRGRARNHTAITRRAEAPTGPPPSRPETLPAKRRRRGDQATRIGRPPSNQSLKEQTGGASHRRHLAHKGHQRRGKGPHPKTPRPRRARHWRLRRATKTTTPRTTVTTRSKKGPPPKASTGKRREGRWRTHCESCTGPCATTCASPSSERKEYQGRAVEAHRAAKKMETWKQRLHQMRW